MNSYRVGIAGFGAIGQSVAQSLNAGLPGLSLAAVAVRDPRPRPPSTGASRRVSAPWPTCTRIATWWWSARRPPCSASWPSPCCGRQEAGGAELGRCCAAPDRTGAPARRPDHRAVRRHPGTGRDHRRRRGRDPFGHDDHAQARARPAGRPYLADNNIDLTGITEPRLVFRGSPREAAVGFPANLNVAVSVSLAGIGPTGPRWKSGPTRRWNAISTASRWIRTRPRSRWKSRTSLGQSQDRPHHRAKRHRRAAQADRAAARGHLSTLAAACSGTSTPPGAAAFPPSAPPTTCPSHPAPAGGYGTHPASLDAPR